MPQDDIPLHLNAASRKLDSHRVSRALLFNGLDELFEVLNVTLTKLRDDVANLNSD